MASIQHFASPLEQTCVAIDLETTGLKAEADSILEVGSVRFRGDDVLDTFQTFVNPGRDIPSFVQRYTGITPQDIRRAPSFNQIRERLGEFIGGDPVVAHSVDFDLGFLESHGLHLLNPRYDTLDLASVLLPLQRRYSLSRLIDELGIRPEQDRSDQRSHRAVYDALAHKELFVKLIRMAEEMDTALLTHLTELAGRSGWPLHRVFAALSEARQASSKSNASGISVGRINPRMEPPERARSDNTLEGFGPERIHGMLGPGGPFAQAFGGFEHRPQQEELLDAVTGAIFGQRHLIVEGGTGVGKSLAYLLPAALFAVSTGNRVVVSTNTINLQEQLIGKDIPALQSVLEEAGVLEPDSLRVAPLKGRANYLCLRRWHQLSRSDSLSVEDAKLLGKTSVWLQDSPAGDRSEINLLGREAATWHHISAGEKGFCLNLRDGSPCFLRAARQRAEQAHIIVVNHALLMTDLAYGGGLIPEYSHVIIDEAHHLEDAATKQFGFELAQGDLEQTWDPAARLANTVRMDLAASPIEEPAAGVGRNAATAVENETPRLRESWDALFAALEALLVSQRRGRNQGDQNQLLITPDVRSASAWAELRLAWENMDARLLQARNAAMALRNFLDNTRLPAEEDQQALAIEAASLDDGIAELASRLASIIDAPKEDQIHWITVNPAQATIALHSAPLDVSPILQEKLFAEKDCVVLTSSTLAVAATDSNSARRDEIDPDLADEQPSGSFEYLKGQVGIPKDTDELLVGSPFDYRRAALLLVPEDMPQPNANGYVADTANVLAQLGQRLEGRTLALFTSYSSLRAVAQRLRPLLEPHDIQVMAQGVDGSAPYLMSAFADEPRSVLLGTASFWEGIDLPSGVLKALVITRLPFQVPSDPIVHSRSRLYDNPFNEYSIPNAVLRFRQGIGRLIRNKEDRGAIVVLDSRVSTHAYGRAFMNAMPPCNRIPCLKGNVGNLAASWLDGGRRGARLR